MNAPTEETTKSGKHYKLGLILGVNSPFYTAIALGAEAEVSARNASLLVEAPTEFNATLQISLVETYIAMGLDALLIAPCDNQALIAPLQRAEDAGIKVITIDSFIGDGNYAQGPVRFPLCYIGSDNLQGGKIAGEALIKTIGGSGTVYIQSTRPGLSATDQREEGFKSAIAMAAGNITLAGVNYDGGSIATAAEQTEAMLQRVPSLSGIFSTGDYSTRGVLQVITSAHKSGQIKIARFDLSEQTTNDIRNGIVDLAIVQKPGDMGKVAVDYALKALSGNTDDLPKHITTDLVVLDRNNVDIPDIQAVLY